MNKLLIAVTTLLALTAIVLTGYLFLHKRPVSIPVVTENKKEDIQTYPYGMYEITFDYSSEYYLKERVVGTTERPQLSLVIVEDTQENRDLFEGRTTEARDGPIAITVDVYPNPDRLTADDWVRADTNWTVRTSEVAPASVGRGKLVGVTYSWDGLYLGKTVIVTRGGRAYVFSVTWLEPDDPILVEFDRILESAEIVVVG